MVQSLHINLVILISLLVVICRSFAEWTITPSHTFAIAGKDFNLTCITGLQGSTFLIWYRNGYLLMYYSRNCEYNPTNGSLKYEFFCTSMTIFTLVIPATVIDDEHGSQWYCSGDKSVNPVVINVFYEPDRNLTLTGYDGSILRLEQNLTLFCQSSGGRPFANLSWTCGPVHMQGINYNLSDKYVSELNLNLNESLSGTICTCKATHPIWDAPVERSSFPLQVYYAPTMAPNITGYKSFQGLREGEDITLTCRVLGGYPQPILTWICGNMLMDAKNKSTEVVAEIVLPLIINRTLHGQQCICNGTSIANYSRASNVFLIVDYPPSAALISNEKQLFSGINYSMFCQVKEGNPTGYYISWSQMYANTVVRNNADLTNLLSNNGHNLTLTEISYKDMGIYTCSVHNYVTDLNGNLIQNKSVSIQKNFSAVFASSNVFQTVSGRSFDVKIPFYCKPKVKNINDLMWLRKENNKQQKMSNSGLSFSLLTTTIRIPFYRTPVTVDGQVAIMTIKVSSYALDGNYVLRVRNIEGVYESFGFEIKVIGTEQQTSLSVIVGCSVGVVIFVAAVVVVVIYVVLRRKTSQGKDRKEKMMNTESYEIPMETSAPNDRYSSLQNPDSGLVNSEYEEITSSSQSNENLGCNQKLNIDTNNKPFPIYTNTTLSDKAFGVPKELDCQQKEDRKEIEMEEPEPVYE